MTFASPEQENTFYYLLAFLIACLVATAYGLWLSRPRKEEQDKEAPPRGQ